MNETLPPYFLKRSSRSRHIRVSVSAGGRVLVVAPKRIPDEVIGAFLASKALRLFQKVEYFKKIPERKISIADEKKLFAAHKKKALLQANEKAAHWSGRYGFSYKRVSIRNSRSRWGSCGSKGTLCFNYKIVFLPERLVDYLVVHEICHLKEHNHGDAFWELVGREIPDYVLRRQQLREFESKI